MFGGLIDYMYLCIKINNLKVRDINYGWNKKYI